MNQNHTIAHEYVFSKGDYKAMRFNVMDVDRGGDLLKSFPELSRFRSFLNLKTTMPKYCEKIIRYICLCYDRQSPAMQQITDVTKRKPWCGMAAGFEYDDHTGIFTKPYYEFMVGTNKAVNDCIIDFLSLENNPDYSMLVLTYENFYRKSIQMGATGSSDDVLKDEEIRGKLYKQLLEQANIMKQLSSQYLADHSPFLREDLYRVINDEVRQRLNLTPEHRATQREQREAKVQAT